MTLFNIWKRSTTANLNAYAEQIENFAEYFGHLLYSE